MRAIIFEPDHGGHRLSYVRHLLSGLYEIIDEVIVCLSAAAPDSPSFQHQLAEWSGRDRITFDSTLAPAEGTPVRIAAAKLAALRDALDRHRPDHVLIPYGDGLAPALGAARLARRDPLRLHPGCEAEALMIGSRFAYGRTTMRQRLTLTAAARAPFTRVHWLDPAAYDHIQQRGGDLAARSRLMPDAVEPAADIPRDAARETLGLPTDTQLITLPGAVNRRKGADLLLRAFADADLPDRTALLLAGRVAGEMHTAITDARAVLGERLHVFDRYLSEDEFRLVFAAADLIAAPYPDHVSPASVITRAAAARRPVLAADRGWMGRTVARFGLGWTCDVTAPRQFAEALAATMTRTDRHTPSDGAEAFGKFHTIPNFQRVWLARLRERLDLPPDPPRPRWHEVVSAADSRLTQQDHARGPGSGHPGPDR